MLFDFGWSEILLIGTVALIFIGPKDLPKAMRVAGYWVRKARTLSREFQSSIDQMIREAELDEMRQGLTKVTEFDLNKEFQNTIDPTGDLKESLQPPELPDFSATAPALAPVVGVGTEAIAAASAHAVPLPAEPTTLDPTWPRVGNVATPGTPPVPVVPGPQSEPDQSAAERSPPADASTPEPDPHGFAPPRS
jgi:sec-independent protein translocase protein TatB